METLIILLIGFFIGGGSIGTVVGFIAYGQGWIASDKADEKDPPKTQIIENNTKVSVDSRSEMNSFMVSAQITAVDSKGVVTNFGIQWDNLSNRLEYFVTNTNSFSSTTNDYTNGGR